MKRSLSITGSTATLVTALAAFSLANLSLVGCSMKSNLDDMHGATMEMNQQTKDMNKQTKDLGAATERMEGNMGEMYDALRQGDSLNARRASLIAMVDAADSVHKISEAGKYFMSFEYQLWSGVGEDTLESRDEVAASAAREFMRDVQEFMDGSVDPLSTDSKAKSLNSLSVAMHLLNHKQEAMLKKHPDLKPISMYGMIQEALLADREMKSGKKKLADFPAYVEAILTYEKEAKILLQARYNYLGAMALARVSKIRDGALSYLNIRYWSGFTAELEDKNTAQIREFARYLSGALKTRDFMSSVGVEPKLDVNLRKIFDSMSLEKSTLDAMAKVRVSSADAPEKDVAVAEFVGLVEKYKGSPLKLGDSKADSSKGETKGESKAELVKKSKSDSKEDSREDSKEELKRTMDELGLPM